MQETNKKRTIFLSFVFVFGVAVFIILSSMGILFAMDESADQKAQQSDTSAEQTPRASDITINATNFPDANFRAYLSAQSYGTDGVITEAEINSITEIKVDSLSIASLKGIEQFTKLSTLSCKNNQLTSLDISNNTTLSNLDCSDNKLTTLDVRNNNLWFFDCSNNALTSLLFRNLIQITCDNNKLTQLDFSANTNIRILSINNNNFTSLDVSGLSDLGSLSCNDNNLTSLDVSKNTALTSLLCKNNKLASLTLGNNTKLETMLCDNNAISSLDLSKCKALTYVTCTANKLMALDTTNNTNLMAVMAGTQKYSIPLTYDYASDTWLSSTNIFPSTATYGTGTTYKSNGQINVTNAAALKTSSYSNKITSLSTNITGTITYTLPEGIALNTVNFPDANFRDFLHAESYGIDSMLTASEISTITSINVENKSINSLKGIEYFTNLDTLYCYNNSLTSLDISKNISLTRLECYDNALTALDVSKNINLTALYCGDNPLSSLDVSKNTALEQLVCTNNGLSSLDISKNTSLIALYCYDNSLTSLDLNKNLALGALRCHNNLLTSLDFSKNPALQELMCSDNLLTSLNLEGTTNLMGLVCENNSLTSLDLSSSLALITLYIDNNSLASLDLSNNSALACLSCSGNELISLDLSEKPDLEELYCTGNKLTSLDLGNSTKLTTAELSDQTAKVPLMYDWSKDRWKSSENIFLNNAKFSSTDVSLVDKGQVIVQSPTDDMQTDFTSEITAGSSAFTLSGNITFEKPEGILINATNFPDENFRNYLLEQSYGSDGIVTPSEISSIKSIIVENKSISNLKGIEHFTALTRLECEKNSLTTLNVTKNTALGYLDCSNNSLTSLDVTNNTALTYLDSSRNSLTSMYVSKNTDLIYLYCYENSIDYLDVSKNLALYVLMCCNNSLTSLDVSNNTALMRLVIYNNSLTTIDISNNLALENLLCYNNAFTSLDVSKNTALTNIDCHDNTLSSLNLSNNQELATLDCSGNSLTTLNLNKNTKLSSAVLTGQVANVPLTYDKTNRLWTSAGNSFLDTTTFTNTNVSLLANGQVDVASPVNGTQTDFASSITIGSNNFTLSGKITFEMPEGILINATNFPDANFRNYLLDQSYGSDGIVTPSEISSIKSIIVENKSISNLKGIEHFTALTDLSCYANSLATLDISKNTALTKLDCGGNLLTQLDVSQNLALTNLNCNYNALSVLDISKNSALTELICDNNFLSTLNVSKNTALTYLNCTYNSLASIDLSKNIQLTTAYLVEQTVKIPLTYDETAQRWKSNKNIFNENTVLENADVTLPYDGQVQITNLPNSIQSKYSSDVVAGSNTYLLAGAATFTADPILFSKDRIITSSDGKSLNRKEDLLEYDYVSIQPNDKMEEPAISVSDADFTKMKNGVVGSYSVQYTYGTDTQTRKVYIVKDGSVISTDGQESMYAKNVKYAYGTMASLSKETLIQDAMAEYSNVNGTTSTTISDFTINDTDMNTVHTATVGSLTVHITHKQSALSKEITISVLDDSPSALIVIPKEIALEKVEDKDVEAKAEATIQVKADTDASIFNENIKVYTKTMVQMGHGESADEKLTAYVYDTSGVKYNESNALVTLHASSTTSGKFDVRLFKDSGMKQGRYVGTMNFVIQYGN